MLEFPEGYFSIKDNFGEVFENESAKKLVLEALNDLAEDVPGVHTDENMLQMASTMSVASIINFAGIKCDHPRVCKLNKELNKITK